VFTGKRADNSTITNTFSLTDPENMHTFTFTGMTDVVSVEWYQYWPYNQFDNVTTSAVPEPATLSVLGIGALALLRRRRK